MYNLSLITEMNTVQQSGTFANQTEFAEGLWLFLEANPMRLPKGLV
jgi:hypothetical protein